MFDAFAEGVRSIVQVCHLVILAPVALAVVSARGRWTAVAGAVLGIVVGGWFFASNRFGTITDLELRVTAALMIVLVSALAFPAMFDRDTPSWSRRMERALRSPIAGFAIPAIVAVMVTQWWRPCVGEELGTILTDAPGAPWGTLPATAAFMVGISIPIIVIGLVYAAASPGADRSTQFAWLGSAGCALLGLSVLAGQHGEIVSRLFQWSQ